MGRKREKRVVERLNATLESWRKGARKVADGSQKPKHLERAACWERLRESKCKTSCCGKRASKMCGKCPRRYVEVDRDDDRVVPLARTA